MAKILVVDDSATQAESLRLALQADGHDAVTASDADAAWQHLGAHACDLVISDILMPGSSGFDLCSRIKNDPALAHIPVVLLTSLSDPSDILRALEVKADNFLTKPVDEAALSERIATILKPLPVTSSSDALHVRFMHREYTLDADRAQILTLLMATFEDIVRTNQQLVASQGDLARAGDRLQEYAEALEDRIDRGQVLEEELRSKNQELLEQNHRVQEATRAKSEFLADMSHELRTPLNSIIGFTEILADGIVGTAPSSFVEYLQDILQSARHLLRLINDVLDLAKVESGNMPFFPEPVSLSRLVQEASELVRTQASRKKIAISVQVDARVDDIVADPSRLKQILYNYLSNAIKFTAERGRVVVRVLPDGPECYRIEVEDTGVGIAAVDLPRLFVEFQQLHDTDAHRRQQGTGLGLSLTRRLVEGQGGHVEVRSTEGVGSVFIAVLPRSMKRTQEAVVSTPVVFGSIGTPVPAGLLPGVRVLAADDDVLTLKLVQMLLRQQGCEVRTATGIQDLLSTLQHWSPHIILMEVHIAGESTHDLVRLIRASPGHEAAVVVAVTASAMKGDEEQALAAGFDDFITKPIEPRTFPAVIAQALKRREPGRV